MVSKKGGSLLLAFWLAFCPLIASDVFADAVSEKQAELSEVRAKMERMEQRKQEARRKAEAASAELDEVVGDLRVIQGEAHELEKQRNALQEKIDAAQAKLAQKEKEVKERQGIYKKRLRDIYINGQINYLDVLLGAKDFSDFSTRMFLLQKVIRSDLDLLAQIRKDAEEIRTYKATLDASMQEIRANELEIEAKRSRVNQLREKRAQVLYKAEEEEQESEEEYERLLAVSERIAAMLRNMEQGGSSNAGGTGRFIWPCHGTITSYFGWRTHPIFGTTKYHSGMDIGVDYGTPIHAADSGTVVYSGWLGGYGYCVMIDHGGGLVSLYGHNQSLNVYEGQYVAQGTVIAYAGSTGYSTGPHCHFEVRLHGEVTEPLNYLP